MIKILADKPEDKKSLRKAFIKFKNAITNPKKNSDNPFTSSRYVDLAAVLEVIANGEKASGLAFTQDVGTNKAQELSCQSILMGESGEIVSSALTVPVVADKHIAKDKHGNPLYDRNGSVVMVSNKRGSQEYGSAETYLRRYSAQSLCGFAGKDEDDDGNASTPRRRGSGRAYSHSNSNQSGKRHYDDNGEGMKGRAATQGQKKFATNLANRAKGCVMTKQQQATVDWINSSKSASGDMYAWSKAIDVLQKVDTSKKQQPQQYPKGKPPHEGQGSLFGGQA